jgi:hypothetical protein
MLTLSVPVCSGQPASHFKWHKDAVTSIEWHPKDPSMLAVAGADNQVGTSPVMGASPDLTRAAGRLRCGICRWSATWKPRWRPVFAQTIWAMCRRNSCLCIRYLVARGSVRGGRESTGFS